jgi:hypothetical protein
MKQLSLALALSVMVLSVNGAASWAADPAHGHGTGKPAHAEAAKPVAGEKAKAAEAAKPAAGEKAKAVETAKPAHGEKGKAAEAHAKKAEPKAAEPAAKKPETKASKHGETDFAKSAKPALKPQAQPKTEASKPQPAHGKH